jgi:hypothetical protein
LCGRVVRIRGGSRGWTWEHGDLGFALGGRRHGLAIRHGRTRRRVFRGWGWGGRIESRIRSAKKALPILGRSGNSPNVSRGLQFNANLAEFTRGLRGKDGTNARSDRARIAAVSAGHLKRDPAVGRILMPRRITATVKVHSDGGSPLLKNLAAAIGAENDKRYGVLDARAAPEVGVFRWALNSGIRRHVHVFSVEILRFKIIRSHIAFLTFFGVPGGDRFKRKSRAVGIDQLFPDFLVSETDFQEEAED